MKRPQAGTMMVAKRALQVLLTGTLAYLTFRIGYVGTLWLIR